MGFPHLVKNGIFIDPLAEDSGAKATSPDKSVRRRADAEFRYNIGERLRDKRAGVNENGIFGGLMMISVKRTDEGYW